MEPVKIIDIIDHQNKYYVQRFLVVDRQPQFLYEREDDWLIGEDSGFFNFYFKQAPDKWAQAFAGRKFEIPTVDGDTIQASGQWWSGVPRDWFGLLVHAAAGTPDGLATCNVFTGLEVDPELIEVWLAKNEPSNNYSKYDKRHEDYGKQTIWSPWDGDGPQHHAAD